MSDKQQTPFSNKCDILAQLWVEYKNDGEFADFIEYNDLGLPLAYAIATEIVTSTPKAELFINETFDLLLSALELEGDSGFETLADLFLEAGQ